MSRAADPRGVAHLVTGDVRAAHRFVVDVPSRGDGADVSEAKALPVTTALLTYADLASLTQIPRATLRMMVLRGQVPHLRLGPRTVRFDPRAVTAWLESRAAGVRS